MDICILFIADEIYWELHVPCLKGMLEGEDRRVSRLTFLPMQVPEEACCGMDVSQQVYDLETQEGFPGVQVWGGGWRCLCPPHLLQGLLEKAPVQKDVGR